MNFVSVSEGTKILQNGGVIAYPTESCYGLGCNPKNHSAVRRILKIKRRSRSKGLIIITDHFNRIRSYISELPAEFKQEILDSWPGPFTWLLPARDSCSVWIRGNHPTIAIRVSRHPTVRRLCALSGMAIISTSANRSNRKLLKTELAVQREFANEVDGIVQGRIGASRVPSTIRDGLSGALIR